MVAEAILRKAKCLVTTVGNGQLAVEALQSDTYDVVFVDMHMPEMNGPGTARRIRSGARQSDIPIIVLRVGTGMASHFRGRCQGVVPAGQGLVSGKAQRVHLGLGYLFSGGVFLSAEAGADPQAGINAHLDKPLDRGRLGAILQEWAGSSS